IFVQALGGNLPSPEPVKPRATGGIHPGSATITPVVAPTTPFIDAIAPATSPEGKKALGPIPNAKTPKRSTERGEAEVKPLAELNQHHQYENGGCLNSDWIGCNNLSRIAVVAKSTASAFFKQHFGGHIKYRSLCIHNRAGLARKLKVLNKDYSPEEH